MLRTAAVAIAAALATVLAAEGVLQLLPVSGATKSGYHIDDAVMGYPPHHRFTVSTGWDLRNPQRLAANNWGFVSDTDFVPDPNAVALVGDSFVEASMLGQPQRPGAQLQAQLAALGQPRPVYAFGSPGTALPDHAQRVRLAHQRLGVRDFVLWVDAGDARQALCGAALAHSRCLDPQTLAPRTERQAPPGTLKQLARHSALLQYVFGQLKLDVGTLARTAFRREVPAEPGAAATAAPPAAPDPAVLARRRAVIDAVVTQFFADVAPYRGGRLLFVVDGRRSAGEPQQALIDLERAHLMARLREGGAEVIDLEPLYRGHMRRSRLSLEVGPYDTHLNALGVRTVMQAAAARLARGAS